MGADDGISSDDRGLGIAGPSGVTKAGMSGIE
jgi:hypothetical protein